MSIVVFGGTGNIGRLVVAEFAETDKVKVLTRQKGLKTENVEYVVGSALDAARVAGMISERDAVIVALGFNNSARDTMSRGTANVIQAIQAVGARRLIVLSAQGAGDSWDWMPEDFHTMVLSEPVLEASFADHSRQEELVKASGLDWTVVRPTEVMERPATGDYSVGVPKETDRFQISKYDVADFLVKVARDDGFSQEFVLITS